MNCKDVQSQLSAYLDGQATLPANAHLKQHLANCVRCGDALQKEIEIRAILRELPDLQLPNPPADYASRAFKAAFSQQRVKAVAIDEDSKADSLLTSDQSSVVSIDRGNVANLAEKPAQPANQHHHWRRQGFYWGFSSAAAVAIMMWGISAMMMTSPQVNQRSAQVASVDGFSQVQDTAMQGKFVDAPIFRVALHQTKKVKLAFNAQKAVEKARISISLPSNFSLEGYPGKRTIEWETQLAAGDNILSLPILAEQVVASGESDYLVARVSHNGGENKLSVRLQVIKPGMSNSEVVTRVKA